MFFDLITVPAVRFCELHAGDLFLCERAVMMIHGDIPPPAVVMRKTDERHWVRVFPQCASGETESVLDPDERVLVLQ